MPFVDEVGVIAMLHGLVSAARGMAMWMALGDGMRGDQLVVIGELRKYGGRAVASDQIGEWPAEHENGDGQQDDECAGCGVEVEGGCRAAHRRKHANGDGTRKTLGEAAH